TQPCATLKPGDPEYQRLTRAEIEQYTHLFLGSEAPPSARVNLLQAVPPSWIEIENRAEAMIRVRTGFDITGHVLHHLHQPCPVKMLSLGCGPGGNELVIARQAPNASITCIDLNPELIAVGRERAKAENLNIQFEVGDLNIIDLPFDKYD